MKEAPDFLAAKGVKVNQTYSYINNAGFYALANKNYYDYYQMTVRVLAQWLDGYVFDFHDRTEGIFSTRLATALVRGISHEVIGNGIFFVATSENRDSLKKLNEWQKSSGFQSAAELAVDYAFGLGTSVFKLNVALGNIWCEAKRLDKFFPTVDFRGRVIDYRGLIKSFARTKGGDDRLSENFYLMEHRYFKTEKKVSYIAKPDGKYVRRIERKRTPYVEYYCHKLTGQAKYNQDNNFEDKGEMRFESLPKDFRDSVIREFGINEFNKAYPLPFKEHLGIVLLRHENGDITLPDLPFGTSILQDMVAYLMSYDLEWSYFVRDLYLGKGMAFIPEYLQYNKRDNAVLSSLDKSVFITVPTTNPETMKPESVQFNMRVLEHEQAQDNILRKIAIHLRISPKTLSSYLGRETEKTATESEIDEAQTLSFITQKRAQFAPALNEVIELVLNYYGLENDVKCRFATPSIVNMEKTSERAIREYSAGLITRKDAIRMINPDISEAELEKKTAEVEAEADARQAREIEALGQNYAL